MSEIYNHLGSDMAQAPVAPSPDRAAANLVDGPSRTRLALTWLRKNPKALVCLGFLTVLILTSLLAPVFARHDPLALNVSHILQSPSRAHPLGTDDLGRDVFSRLLFGSRVSLVGALIATGLALLIGIPIGLIGGSVGGWLDDALMRVVDTLLSFPAIVLAVGVIGSLGPGLVNAMLAIGIIYSPVIARLMRGQVLAVKGAGYVDASRSFGSSRSWVVLRHILPNSIQPVLVQATLLFALSLLAESGLSFLGLGVQAPDPSWGAMLGRAYRFAHQAPFQILVPGLAIMLTVLCLNVLGDMLRTALDPRSRER